MIIGRFFFMTVLLVAGQLACSASRADSDLDDCAGLLDDAQRLACYDRVAGQSGSGTDAAIDTLPVAAPAPPAEASPTAVRALLGATEESEIEAAAGQAAGGSEGAQRAEDDFGAGPRMRRNENAETELREIHASVVSIDQTASGKRVFYLDNGHVWREQSKSRSLRLSPGESVRIKAGSLGSYKLFGNGKVSTKVDRMH
jgi:hypothetical protein